MTARTANRPTHCRCGVELVQAAVGRPKLHCSHACQSKYRYRDSVCGHGPWYCVGCGNRLQGARRKWCLAAACIRKRWALTRCGVILGQCCQCSKQRMLRSLRCVGCARDREVAAKRLADRRGNHVRRARIRNTTVEMFHDVEIFERDKWRCQRCNVKCRRGSCRYKGNYPHLDHIVSLSNGGTHTRTNVQLLCRACNLRKNNHDTGDQLLLVG